MKTSNFDYPLPPEFIAQTPIEPRDASRLMVLNRATGALQHSVFGNLGQFLRPDDVLVFNNTRVIPARLFARRADTGGKAEILMLKRRAPLTWEVLIGGKGNRVGSLLRIDGHPTLEAIVMQEYADARRLVQFSQPITPLLDQVGRMPLPPYIHESLNDQSRYQTVFAEVRGSAAAPTAGLHFTQSLLQSLRAQGIRTEYLTLHVGLDTFRPVHEEEADTHPMHGEWCELIPEVAERLNAAKQAGQRIIAVGTTSVRALESAAQNGPVGQLQPFSNSTELFILPGYTFRFVDAMITNFHLPKSTLLMLVSAFASREHILNAYEVAKRERYRFYSFGDAMFIG